MFKKFVVSVVLTGSVALMPAVAQAYVPSKREATASVKSLVRDNVVSESLFQRVRTAGEIALLGSDGTMNDENIVSGRGHFWSGQPKVTRVKGGWNTAVVYKGFDQYGNLAATLIATIETRSIANGFSATIYVR